MFTLVFGRRIPRMVAARMAEFPYPDREAAEAMVLKQISVEADRFPWN